MSETRGYVPPEAQVEAQTLTPAETGRKSRFDSSLLEELTNAMRKTIEAEGQERQDIGQEVNDYLEGGAAVATLEIAQAFVEPQDLAKFREMLLAQFANEGMLDDFDDLFVVEEKSPGVYEISIAPTADLSSRIIQECVRGVAKMGYENMRFEAEELERSVVENGGVEGKMLNFLRILKKLPGVIEASMESFGRTMQERLEDNN